MWRHYLQKRRGRVWHRNCLLSPKLSYQSMKLYEFTRCTKWAISHCLIVILIKQWCDNNVGQTCTCTQRVVGWSPCLCQQPIFHNVKNSQSALPDRKGSAAQMSLNVTQLRSIHNQQWQNISALLVCAHTNPPALTQVHFLVFNGGK